MPLKLQPCVLQPLELLLEQLLVIFKQFFLPKIDTLASGKPLG